MSENVTQPTQHVVLVIIDYSLITADKSKHTPNGRQQNVLRSINRLIFSRGDAIIYANFCFARNSSRLLSH